MPPRGRTRHAHFLRSVVVIRFPRTSEYVSLMDSSVSAAIASAIALASASFLRRFATTAPSALLANTCTSTGRRCPNRQQPANGLMVNLERIRNADEKRAQCCQLRPNPQIDGLLTSTRTLPCAKSCSQPLLFHVGVVRPAICTAPSMAAVNALPSSFRSHQTTHGCRSEFTIAAHARTRSISESRRAFATLHQGLSSSTNSPCSGLCWLSTVLMHSQRRQLVCAASCPRSDGLRTIAPHARPIARKPA